MPVKLTDMLSLVIPIEKLALCPGISDLDQIIDAELQFGQRDESLLVIPSAQSQGHLIQIIEQYKALGLKPTKQKQGENCWNDLCLVDLNSGPTAPCDWLEWDAASSTVSLKEGSIKPCQGTLIMAHGKESGPDGNKLMVLARAAGKLGFRVIRPDFRSMPDPDQRVAHLLDLARGVNGPLYLAGSSMGGYVAIRASQVLETAGLFLMAPAIGLPGYADQLLEPGCSTIRVVHAWQDEVIPVQQVITWAQQHKAELHLVNSDHRLSSELELLKFLLGCMLKKTTR